MADDDALDEPGLLDSSGFTPSEALEDRHTSGAYSKRPLTLVRGQGARVWDDAGKEYIDCVGGQGAGNVGHCHPKVVSALQAQAATLMLCPEAFYHPLRA